MPSDHDFMLKRRGINNPCDRCGGFGVMLYGSTATWRGGIGGAAMTYGVCNRCWGSGDAFRPWPSHKEFEYMEKQLKKKASNP